MWRIGRRTQLKSALKAASNRVGTLRPCLVCEAALGSLDKEFPRAERTYPGRQSKERGCQLMIKVRMPRSDDGAIKRNVALSADDRFLKPRGALSRASATLLAERIRRIRFTWLKGPALPRLARWLDHHVGCLRSFRPTTTHTFSPGEHARLSSTRRGLGSRQISKAWNYRARRPRLQR